MADGEIVYDELLSVMGRSLQPNAIRKLTALLGRRDIISLAAGAPSSETFPIEALAEIAARVIRSRGQFALQYGPTRGPQSLLEAIAEMLGCRGINLYVVSLPADRLGTHENPSRNGTMVF